MLCKKFDLCKIRKHMNCNVFFRCSRLSWPNLRRHKFAVSIRLPYFSRMSSQCNFLYFQPKFVLIHHFNLDHIFFKIALSPTVFLYSSQYQVILIWVLDFSFRIRLWFLPHHQGPFPCATLVFKNRLLGFYPTF